MFKSERFNQTLNRILQVLVLIYQGVALLAFLAIPLLAASWLKTPFIGAFVEQTLVFNGVGPIRTDGSWQLFHGGVTLGNHLLKIDGQDIRNTAEMQAVLSSHESGAEVEITYLTPGDEQREITVKLQDFPTPDRFTYLILPYLIGLVYLAISLWVFGLRRSEAPGRAFTLFATSMALGAAVLFDVYTTHRLTFLWIFATAVAGGALIDLAMVFPQEVRWVVKYPYLRWIGYPVSLVLFLLAAINLYNFNAPHDYILNWRYIYIQDGIALLFFVGLLIYRSFRAPSPVVRRQARYILGGLVGGFGWLAGWMLFTAIRPSNFYPFLLLFTVIFPIVTAYTLLRQRLTKTDYLTRRGVLYASLIVLVVIGYVLVALSLSLVFGTRIEANNPWLIGGVVVVLAVVLNPLRDRLQKAINLAFFRGEAAYQQHVQEFSHEMTNTVDLAGILRALRHHIISTLIPDQMHIFIYDPINDQYIATAGDGGRPTSDIRFGPASPLVELLKNEHLPIFLSLDHLPSMLVPEQARLALLGAILYVPLPGGERLIGWLALSPRLSGENYTAPDLTFLEELGDQSAVAIERAQVVSDMERRVREMNILSIVAQGVNVTIAFDDILELIYSQTNKIISADDFHVTLLNRENEFFYYAFCLEKEDRLTHRENLPLPPGTGLEAEVVHSRRSILTADYDRECMIRGVIPSTSGLYAWLGVPLNAGAETIGALTIGSRDPGVSYTLGQQELLQSIADQAAGAIIKARLLQETEHRAHQLATLNEITRQLTGTLETEPLLQKILDSAVSILNCEAGSLFLVDEQTDELVFRATAGPVASNLAGQRLAPGTGIAGEAVRIRKPIVANDVQEASAWFASPDEETGFITRALLAVPLQVKDRVIGVLEVINRKDGLLFVEDDQNLLAAFAGQAAVAIENARLYTLTDKELSNRIDELSVMQRIDRELNASLDVVRAMRITLDWAMRQSAAEAGLIGALNGDGVRIMAQVGYDALVADHKDSPLPLDQPAMLAAVETGQPQSTVLADDVRGLLPDARSQVVTPIRREADVIGLIVLESRSPDTQPDAIMSFLTRLSDHASIAIANAQLYTEVQSASIAKSEFVSFVSHELKNPMTSIKGYTELISAGAVGEINEMQTNFLNTIRSNVERMSTLVSDLSDNSKIEAGRLRLEFRSVDMAEVMDEVIRSSKRQFDDKKQAFILNWPANLPKIWADRTRLVQILTNLVSNAHKYTPEGGTITIGAEQVENRWDPEGADQVVHIWVADNGIGINQEDQKKIFEKFFRSEDQKAREVPGTGLGLNITRSLVEMQGGRIWFESEFRQGTTFHFTIPVAEG